MHHVAWAQGAGVSTGDIGAKALAPLKPAPVAPTTSSTPAPTARPTPVKPALTPAASPSSTAAATASASPAQDIQTGGLKVGLLVPLSSADAQLAKAIIDAALLGLYDLQASQGKPPAARAIQYLVKDTKGTPEGARQAAIEALQDGAVFILGPLTDVESQLLGPVLQSTNKWAFNFSQSPTLRVPNLVQCGAFASQQVQRLLDYATKRKATKLAAMGRQNAAGRTTLEALNHAFSQRGILPVGVANIGAESRQLTLEIDSLATDIAKITRRDGVGLFLATDAKDTESILRFLVEKKKVPRPYLLVLGTQQWDEEEILNQYTMQDAIFTSAMPEKYDQFAKRFKGAYEYPAPRVASMAYDLSIMLARLAAEHGVRAFEPQHWEDPVGFDAPANGLFRIRNNQVCERSFAILKTDGRGKKTTLDPAPVYFEKDE